MLYSIELRTDTVLYTKAYIYWTQQCYMLYSIELRTDTAGLHTVYKGLHILDTTVLYAIFNRTPY